MELLSHSFNLKTKQIEHDFEVNFKRAQINIGDTIYQNDRFCKNSLNLENNSTNLNLNSLLLDSSSNKLDSNKVIPIVVNND